ncbi:MAG: hypothetical protein J1F35_07640 [Erysipelotrichales bacterium]|nr:hypothetical protein [Erysipelotrichales bacterium]
MGIYLYKAPKIKVGINYFLDCNKGVMVDFSECINCEKLMLSEVRYLCDNVTSLKLKDNYYYIGNYKYLSKSDVEKYLDETFDELSKGVLNYKTYLCLEHHGKYSDRKKAYKEILEMINYNHIKIAGIPIEQYIFGSWNQEDENKYITNIMIPIDMENS